MLPMQVARYLYLVTLMPAASAVAGLSPTARRCRPVRVRLRKYEAHERDDDGEVGQEAVGEEDLAEPAEVFGEGQGFA